MTKKRGPKEGQNVNVNLPNTENSTKAKMKQLFGFDLKDLSSCENFVNLMSRPCDPTSLAAWRIMFGTLMTLDLLQERGLSSADIRWGDQQECRFPLFNFLEPLPLEWMYLVYMIAVAGALGLLFGFMYRISCICLLVPYWYIFLLDKSSWNNHSYLFGLLMFLFLLTDANRVWSIDSLIFKHSNTHVPLWNYAIYRTQFFILYFFAGLKKLDQDWVQGFSMNDLSKHWTFEPFRVLLTNEQIDYFVVHMGGLMLDMTSGYLLFFDLTRPYITFFLLQFHIMNSQLFNIGMFPYTCIASTWIFYSTSWPKYLLNKLPTRIRNYLVPSGEPQPSSHCLYEKEYIKPESKTLIDSNKKNVKHAKSKASLYHKAAAVFFLLYVSEQAFLPYSHWLTKGYNTNGWTNGLYGYSWDMMVHSWSLQHVRISAVRKDTGEVMYLNPEAWTTTRRWNSHPDMMKQYAKCIEERLAQENITNISLYFDVYRSLNDRFQQRMFDPRVDILEAEWHPLKEVSWVLPLLVDLSDWRAKLDELEKGIYKKANDTDVVFIADFPGLELDQFVPEDLGNTSITILNGEVVVELEDKKKNVTLGVGESMQVPPGEFHTVYTVSDIPSCYMYIYVNTTEAKMVEKITQLNGSVATPNEHSDFIDNKMSDDGKMFHNIPDLSVETLAQLAKEDPSLVELYSDIQAQKLMMEQKANETFTDRMKSFVKDKYSTLYRSYEMSFIALKSIATGKSMEYWLNNTIIESDNW